MKCLAICNRFAKFVRNSRIWRSLRFSFNKVDFPTGDLTLTRGLPRIDSPQSLTNFLRDVFVAYSVMPVKELVLPEAKSITANQMKELLSCVPDLQRLEIPTTCCITNSAMRHFAKLRSLESLSLQNQIRISDDGIAFLKSIRSLKHLDVSGCLDLTMDGIASLLERNPSIASIDIQSTHITDSVMERIARCAQQLTSLKVALDSNIQGSTIEAFVGGCTNIEQLTIKSQIASSDTLEKLSSLPKLRRLDVVFCDRKSDGKHVTLRSRLLRELTLRFASGVHSLNLDCQSLETMTIAGGGFQIGSDDSVLRCPNMKNIEVFDLLLPDSFIGSCLLPGCHSLETIKLDGCKGLSAVDVVSGSLNSISILSCVDLVNVRVECDSLSALKVVQCPQIKRCDLLCPKLSDLSLFPTNGQQRMTELTHFRFHSDAIKELQLQGCENIQEVVLKSKSIVSLNLSECRRLSSLDILCETLKVIHSCWFIFLRSPN